MATSYYYIIKKKKVSKEVQKEGVEYSEKKTYEKRAHDKITNKKPIAKTKANAIMLKYCHFF